MTPTSPPLRERKRAAMLEQLERAAVELAAEHGYDAVTIEMICEACMTSPRTFYNYLGSKEAAILGPRTPFASEEQVQRFVHEPTDDILVDFLSMVIDSLTENAIDPELYQLRQRVIYTTPELSAKRLAIDGEIEARYRAVIVERFRVAGRIDSTDAELDDEAHMVIALTRGVLTYTAAKWYEPGFDRTVRELIEDSIVLVRRVLKGSS
ncbi:MAG: TetR family transcriptional regulator [Microcella sp.]|uniref:TetR/AcrR family transcriptional regulator n=1 Tax=Microcella sp. TaxID=1913979 RepID=UPI00271CA393|nr:TetR/AcrR family transcriptional regulator [Microcella sp.]MDO8336675.1 TetR family transcriptional regulator [Microcella sp.]